MIPFLMSHPFMLSNAPSKLFDVLGQLIFKVCVADTEAEIYDIVAKGLPLLIPADRVSVALITPNQAEIEVFALEGLDSDLQLGTRLPLNMQTSVGKSILSQKAQLVSISPNSPYSDLIRLSSEGMVKAMHSPLFISDQVIGSLNVGSCSAELYGEAELALLTQIAALVATNIERLRLIQQAHASMVRHLCQAERLTILNEMGQRLSSAMTEEVVFHIVAEAIEHVLKADRVSYVVPNPDGLTCQIFALMGNDVIPKAQSFVLEGSGIAVILQREEAMAFPDLSASDYPEHAMLVSQGLRMGWSVPIRVAGEIVGILNAATTTRWPFPDEALSLLKALGRFMETNIERINAQQKVNLTLHKLEHQVYHDLLTGLPNRNRLIQILDQEIQQSQPRPFAILYLDLDGYKRINDSLNHSVGDQLLRAVADRCRQQLHAGDLVARIGGDEFAVLLKDIPNSEKAIVRTQQLLQTLSEPFTINRHHLQISGNIGISLFPDHGQAGEELLKQADIAMYVAKKKGANTVQLYEGQMSEQLKLRLDLERDLRQAIAQNELYVLFHPQVDVLSGQIQAIEALIRWMHPQRGEISPEVFIPIAEEMGLISEISAWVLDESLRSLASIHDRYPDLYVSVNISAHDLLDSQALSEQIETALSRHHLSGHALELELTETVFLHHAEAVTSSIQTWHQQGVRLALDDFGTGFSSLSNLLNLPMDTLKIDRTFVRSIHSESRKQGIVKTILDLGRNLEVICVAEGVENREQFHCLQKLGCDKVQGSLLSKPMTLKQLESFLQEHKHRDWLSPIERLT